MKSIIKYTSVFLGIFLVSCVDFLEEKITTSYDGSVMVSSPEALEANVLGIHRQLASSGFKSGTFCEWLAPGLGPRTLEQYQRADQSARKMGMLPEVHPILAASRGLRLLYELLQVDLSLQLASRSDAVKPGG